MQSAVESSDLIKSTNFPRSSARTVNAKKSVTQLLPLPLKVALQAGVCALLILSFQLAAPLDASPTLPKEVNLLLMVMVNLALVTFSRSASWDRRLVICVCLLSEAHIVWLLFPLSDSLPIIASKVGAGFSVSIWGIAWVGLLHAWCALGWGFLLHEMLASISEPPISRGIRISIGSLGAVVAGFGLRAVIGYATGSTALLVAP